MYTLHLWASSIAITYFLICFTWTFVARFGLCGFYSSAHAATLGIFVSVILWLECATPQLMNQLLQLSKLPPHRRYTRSARYVSYGLAIIIYILFIFNALIFTALSMAAGISNFDRLLSVCFYWASVTLLSLKFFIIHRRYLEKKAIRRNRLRRRERGNANIGRHIPFEMDFERNDGKLTRNAITLSALEKNWKRYSSQILCIVVGSMAFMIYVLFLVGVFINESMTTHDRRLYPVRQFLVEVKLPLHRSRSIYLRCFGHGNLTIITESDIGRPALLSLEFIQELLSQMHNGVNICIYDRFGYGWSDGIEHDWIHIRKNKDKYSLIETILPTLLQSGFISKPLVYVGVGFGTIRVIDYVQSYPNSIDGVILIDPLSFVRESYENENIITTMTSKYPLWVNFLPMGWLRVAWHFQQISLRHLLFYDFSATPKSITNEVYASLMSGGSFQAALHEVKSWTETRKGDFNASAELLKFSLRNISGKIPLLLLDRFNLQTADLDTYRRENIAAHILTEAETTDDVMYTTEGMSNIVKHIRMFLNATELFF